MKAPALFFLLLSVQDLVGSPLALPFHSNN